MESTNMETDVNTKHQGDEPEDPFAFIDEPLVGADDVEINPALKDVAYEDVGDALQVQIKDEITESELEDEIVQDVFIKEEPGIDLDEDMDNVINSAEIKDSPAKDSNKGNNSDQQTQNSSSNTAQTSSNLDMYTTDTGTRIFFPKGTLRAKSKTLNKRKTSFLPEESKPTTSFKKRKLNSLSKVNKLLDDKQKIFSSETKNIIFLSECKTTLSKKYQSGTISAEKETTVSGEIQSESIYKDMQPTSLSDDTEQISQSNEIQTAALSFETQPSSSETVTIKSENNISLLHELSTTNELASTGKKKHKRGKKILTKRLKCDRCRYKTFYESLLEKHMNTQHGEFNCDLCSYKTTQKIYLNVHMKKHKYELLNCEHCKYETKSKRHFKNHQKIHEENLYTCGLCDYKAKQTYAAFKIHVRSHTLVKFHCEVCTFKTSHRFQFNKHVKQHSKDREREFKCPLCDYGGYDKRSLKQHMLVHTGERKYHCKLCDYKAAKSSNLVRHMYTHTGEKNYACTMCDYKAVQKASLETHMKHAHLENFEPKKPGRISKLEKHVVMLEGKKYYQCPDCDFKGAWPGNFRRHLDVVHGGKRNFFCDFCDYSAGQKTALQVHMKKHTNDQILIKDSET